MKFVVFRADYDENLSEIARQYCIFFISQNNSRIHLFRQINYSDIILYLHSAVKHYSRPSLYLGAYARLRDASPRTAFAVD